MLSQWKRGYSVDIGKEDIGPLLSPFLGSESSGPPNWNLFVIYDMRY